jgi:hypothetical protein
LIRHAIAYSLATNVQNDWTVWISKVGRVDKISLLPESRRKVGIMVEYLIKKLNLLRSITFLGFSYKVIESPRVNKHE